MLDREGLVDYIDAHYREPGDRLFRLEQLPVYADNADTLARWRAGETEPDWHSPWSGILAAEHDRGLRQQRVRVLSAGLTDDERASCLLAYPTNGRHEEIRVLRHGEHDLTGVPREDFWLIEPARGGRVHLALMHYDETGSFVGATDVDDRDTVGAYLVATARTWSVAEPFSSWYLRHGSVLVHRKAA